MTNESGQFVRRSLAWACVLVVACMAACIAGPGADDTRESHREALLHDRLAGVACDRGLWQVAVDEWHEAARLEPSWSRPYQGMARAYERLGQDSLARMAIRRATRLAPRDPLAWFNQGWLEWKGGDAATARTAFYQALALQPCMAPPHQGLGAAYASPGFRAHLYLAVLEHARGNHALAAFHFRRSLLAPSRLEAGFRQPGALVRLYHHMLTPGWTSDSQALHLCLSGPGFFRVRTSEGDAYTPGLSLRLDDARTEVVTVEGWRLYVKGRLGATLAAPTLFVHCEDGRLLTAEGKEIGTLDVVGFARPWKLRALPEGLLASTPEARPESVPPTRGEPLVHSTSAAPTPPAHVSIGVGMAPLRGFPGIPMDEVQATLDLVCGLLEDPTFLTALEQPQDPHLLHVLPQLQAAWWALPQVDAQDRARLATAIEMSTAGALRRLNRVEDSTAHSREAARCAPDNPYAIYNVGYLLDLQGRPQEARPCLERALALATPPADHSLLVGRASFLLGREALDRGDLAEAQRRLERALATLPPPLVEPLGVLGRLEMRRGRPVHALIYWLEALERNQDATRTTAGGAVWRPELEPEIVRHIDEGLARLDTVFNGLGPWTRRMLAGDGTHVDVPADWSKRQEGRELALYLHVRNRTPLGPDKDPFAPNPTHAPDPAAVAERTRLLAYYVSWATAQRENVLTRSLAYQACVELMRLSTDEPTVRAWMNQALSLFPQAGELILVQAWRLEADNNLLKAFEFLDRALRLAKAPPLEAVYCLPQGARPVPSAAGLGGSRSICPEDTVADSAAPRLASVERVLHTRGHVWLRWSGSTGALEDFVAGLAALRGSGRTGRDDSPLGWSLKVDVFRALADCGAWAEAVEAAEQFLLTAKQEPMYTVGGSAWRVLAQADLAAGRPVQALAWLRRYVAWIMGNGWAMGQLSSPAPAKTPNPWQVEWAEVKALFDKAGVRVPATRPPKPPR